MSSPPHDPNPSRREFFKQTSAVVVSGICGAVPMVAGTIVFLDPLRRKSEVGEPIRVTNLGALPPDGIPRKFTIVSTHTDAWNRDSAVPIGAVYLRRLKQDQVEALNVVCPHAGCFVNYLAERNVFLCPCHNSLFSLDGKLADAKSPSPRAMDTLEVDIRNGIEVWVKFQNFRAGHAEKLPTA